MWRASFTMCSHFGVSFAEDKDPVEALMLAFTSAKLKKPRATLNLKPEPEPVDASDTNDADGPAPGNPIAPPANVDGGVTIDFSDPVAVTTLVLNGRDDIELAKQALALGAVFMGANTYIGNGPNFLVKSIAEEPGPAHVDMPSFGRYVLWALAVLVPLFVVLTLLFFQNLPETT